MLTNEQKLNRRSRLGGSDFPALMGDSKFTTAWDLLLDKSGRKPIEFKENMYASLGNILEPIIQEKMGTTNMDDFEFTNENYYLPLVAHIDGIKKMPDSQDILIEIKVSSGDIKDVYNQYRAQIQSYLHITGMKKAELHLLQRTGKIKEAFDTVKLKHFGAKDWQVEYTDEQQFVEEQLAQEFSKVKILKKDIQVMKIKYDQELQLEIGDKLSIFFKYLEMLENDPFLNEEEIKQDFEREMNGQHQVVNYDTSKLIEFENQFAVMKKLKNDYEFEKQKLLEFMLNMNIKKIDNENFSITVKQASERKSIDSKKLKEELPEVADKYTKVSQVKESLLITLKEK